MYGNIHSHRHTHRQKYTRTGTGGAETPSLSSGFSILCTKPEVHLLSQWHHKLAFALSSCQSPSSSWKVVPVINKICPTPGHTPFLTTHRKEKVIPKKGFVIPLSHAWNYQYFHRQPGRQGTWSRCTSEEKHLFPPKRQPPPPIYLKLFNSKRGNEGKVLRPVFFLPVLLGMVHSSQIPKQLLGQRKEQYKHCLWALKLLGMPLFFPRGQLQEV